MKSVLSYILFFFAYSSSNAQFTTIDFQINSLDSLTVSSYKKDSFSLKKSTKLKSFIVPATLITYGFITMSNHDATSINGKLQKSIWVYKPHTSKNYDNYLMLIPAVSVYALNAFGVKGKNTFRDRSIIYLMSNIVATGIVFPVKKITKQQRPDLSNNYSFPSGHTAMAFASAEFMRMEFKDVSPWYGVAGYAMATATGYLRMYNNKHWFSDVVAGAGIGIASTKLAYWLYPKIQHGLLKDKKSNTIILPTYQSGAFGIGLLHSFE